MTSHLILWKKEARDEFDKQKFGMYCCGGDFCEGASDHREFANDIKIFIDTLIDRIHAHTLEEVRGKVERFKVNDAAYAVYNDRFVDEILAALELLEHPTD